MLKRLLGGGGGVGVGHIEKGSYTACYGRSRTAFKVFFMLISRLSEVDLRVNDAWKDVLAQRIDHLLSLIFSDVSHFSDLGADDADVSLTLSLARNHRSVLDHNIVCHGSFYPSFVPTILLGMFEALAVFAALSQWMTFGPTPLPEQVAEGMKIYAQGKGIDRTLDDSRAVLGVWFDGRIKDDVESLVWISPRMASRWLGYLEAKEKWPKGEIQERWDKLRAFVGRRLCFVARLSAMPRLRGLDMDSEGTPSPVDIEHPEFRLTTGPGYDFPKPALIDRILRMGRTHSAYPPSLRAESPLPFPVAPAEVRLLARWQSRDRGRLERYVWFQDLPCREMFAAKGQTFEQDSGYGLGDFGSAWYWAAFDPGHLQRCAGGFDVWVLTPNKQRVGSFRLK